MRLVILVLNFLAQLATVQPVVAQQRSSKPLVEEGHLTAADNVRLHYRKVGEGSDFIVYLHGGPGGSMENDGFLRGCGRSDVVKDPALLTAASHVRDLEALREHFRIQKMSLIGLSWGSGLAILYADAHPERITRIVFLSPMSPANKPYAQQRSEKIASLIAPKDAERLTACGKNRSLTVAAQKAPIDCTALAEPRASAKGRLTETVTIRWRFAD